MTRTISWIDRLRIERVVWMLDQRLYDLPRRSRVSKRREVRQNLLLAAQDVGTRQALRHLGDSRALATEYLTAEFGEGPRHSWIAAGLFAATFPFLLIAFLSEATGAFGDGITAADPNATGTFSWSGVAFLQTKVTYTFLNGESTHAGGALSPLSYVFWIVGTILVGRLWRLVTARRTEVRTV